MKYSRPEIHIISTEMDEYQRNFGADGPSKCSNSCCFYRDGATW